MSFILRIFSNVFREELSSWIFAKLRLNWNNVAEDNLEKTGIFAADVIPKISRSTNESTFAGKSEKYSSFVTRLSESAQRPAFLARETELVFGAVAVQTKDVIIV